MRSKFISAAAGHRGHSGEALLIASNASNINLFTLFGSPTVVTQYTVTIDTGVVINSTSTSAAIYTGAFPAGSALTIINNGQIIGSGGAGANGNNSSTSNHPGLPGNVGGNAISTLLDITIDNTSGTIFGGGGGGGSGGGGIGTFAGSCIVNVGGSAGGGGAGNNGGAGGTAYFSGLNGSAGSTTGGAGGASQTVTTGGYTGAGGAGGAYGSAGVAGGASGGVCGGYSGGAGGAAGNAVALNTHSITWLGGNNSTQVKGPVA
jgi:hypothetical protein